ncbi:MAG: SIMPL domain-containing protein [Anaerolineales bacterium]
MRSKLFWLAPVLALALILTACSSRPSSEQAAPRTLNVTGVGTVYLSPDIAYLYMGVHTEDADISAAVDENNRQTQAVVNALTAMGIAASDIQTSNFSVWGSQQYDPVTGTQAGIIYMVDNTVYVTVRDLDKLPDVLDAAISAGANNINSLQFDVADKSAALQEARQLAMENANRLAAELADNAGLELGEIQTLSYSDSLPVSYGYGYGMGGGGGEGGAATPISPGQLPLTVYLTITYEIR